MIATDRAQEFTVAGTIEEGVMVCHDGPGGCRTWSDDLGDQGVRLDVLQRAVIAHAEVCAGS